jgi:hypothetical protein
MCDVALTILLQPDFPIFDNFTYVVCGDGCLQVRTPLVSLSSAKSHARPRRAFLPKLAPWLVI